MPNRLRFSWPLTLVVLAWALNYVALKLLYVDHLMTASQVAFLRYLVMYAALVALCLLNRESLRLPKEDRRPVLLFGFFTMGVYVALFLEAMRYTEPAEGAILLNLSPILTMLLAALLKQEPLLPKSLGGAVVAFAGVVMVTAPTPGAHPTKALGYILMLSSAAVWAYCIVLMKPLLARYSPLRLMTLSMPGGLPVMLGYWLYMDHGYMPIAQLPPLGWLMFAHVALLSGVMGFLLFYRGVHEIGPASAALYIFLVPPMTALFQWAFTGKTLTPIQMVGLIVVIAGVALAQKFRSAAQPEVAPCEPG